MRTFEVDHYYRLKGRPLWFIKVIEVVKIDFDKIVVKAMYISYYGHMVYHIQSFEAPLERSPEWKKCNCKGFIYEVVRD